MQDMSTSVHNTILHFHNGCPPPSYDFSRIPTLRHEYDFGSYETKCITIFHKPGE